MTTTSEHPALSNLVSFFSSAFDQEPSTNMTLGEILERIRSCEWQKRIDALRRMIEKQDDKGYQDAKRRLPAFSMSGACATRDAQTPLDAKFLLHSGILQCDLDKKDNPHMDAPDAVAAMLADDPHVLFVFASPSGVGLKAGVLIAIDIGQPVGNQISQHARAFAGAEKYFLEKYALQIDRSTKDPLRLCFVSADAQLHINHAASAMALPEIVAQKPASDTWMPPLETTAEDIREMLRFVPPRPDYADWLRIASAVWSALPMAEGCQLLAEWSPEEKAGEYTGKWKHRLEQIGIGTLVHYAQQHGFDAATAARRKRWAGRIRFADSLANAEAVDAGGDPAANVHYVELTREFLFDCFNQAQLGDARLWAARVQGTKLFDHLAQSWRTYGRGIWERDDTEQTIIECADAITEAYARLAASVADEMREKPAPEGKKDIREKVIDRITERKTKLRNKAYITGVLSFAESLLATKATRFDRQPHLLCVENGVLDFDAGVFREHRPADMLTIRTGITFDPDAKCPRWIAFLNYVMGDDRELVSYLARMVGYSLTGYVDKDVLTFNYGKGANGKSTFTSILKMLGGDFMTTISIDALLAKASDSTFDYKKAMLEGKRIVVTDEIPENRRLNESAIKSLVGGDDIVARRPYEKPYVFAPTHKLWLIGNHKPDIKGVDHGIWRRIHLVPWTVTIPEEKRRPRHEVLAELRAELPGVLNWAVRGYIDMADNGGLRPPAKVQEAVKEYQQDSDQLAQFIDERVERIEGINTKATALLRAYMAWCQDNGEEPRYKSSRKLIGYLREHEWRAEKMGHGYWLYVLNMKLAVAQLNEGDEDDGDSGGLFTQSA